jgi:hypothetical protein
LHYKASAAEFGCGSKGFIDVESAITRPPRFRLSDEPTFMYKMKFNAKRQNRSLPVDRCKWLLKAWPVSRVDGKRHDGAKGDASPKI